MSFQFHFLLFTHYLLFSSILISFISLFFVLKIHNQGKKGQRYIIIELSEKEKKPDEINKV